MFTFRAVVHPAAIDSGEETTLGEGIEMLPAWRFPALGSVPALPVTFDAAAEAMLKLPKLYYEPDGSFVWTGRREGRLWQFDGLLVDQGPLLSYVELNARDAPAESLDRLLGAFGWPAGPLMFQLPQQALFLLEPEFRRWARSSGS